MAKPAQAEPKPSDVPQPEREHAATTENQPLELNRLGRANSDSEVLPGAESILESAYGAEKRSIRRKARWRRLRQVGLKAAMVLALFAGTLVYAHGFAGIPLLEPIHWYVPFFLSAALSAWFGLHSARLWDQSYQLLALFGFATAGALIYWNIHVLHYAVGEDRQDPHIRLTIPSSVSDLYYAGEFDALRGIPQSKSAYARISSSDYREAFYAMPRDQWRNYFQRYLSADEIQSINVANIDTKMHEVARRLASEREATLEQMEAAIEEPSLKFRIQQAALRPYTWIIGFL